MDLRLRLPKETLWPEKNLVSPGQRTKVLLHLMNIFSFLRILSQKNPLLINPFSLSRWQRASNIFLQLHREQSGQDLGSPFANCFPFTSVCPLLGFPLMQTILAMLVLLMSSQLPGGPHYLPWPKCQKIVEYAAPDPPGNRQHVQLPVL